MKNKLTIISMVLLASIAGGDTIIQKISFQDVIPVFEKAGEYQSVKCSGLTNYGQPGAPWLPVKTVTLLLPPQARVRSIKINDAFRELPGSYNILPAQQCLPISENTPKNFLKDSLIYRSNGNCSATKSQRLEVTYTLGQATDAIGAGWGKGEYEYNLYQKRRNLCHKDFKCRTFCAQ